MLSPQRYLPGTDRVFGKRALVPVIRSLTVALRVLKKTGLGRQGGRMIAPDDHSGDETTVPYANNQHGVID